MARLTGRDGIRHLRKEGKKWTVRLSHVRGGEPRVNRSKRGNRPMASREVLVGIGEPAASAVGLRLTRQLTQPVHQYRQNPERTQPGVHTHRSPCRTLLGKDKLGDD